MVNLSIRALALSTLLGASAVSATDVIIPNTFQPNTPAVADDVNENFEAFETAVDDNDARIATLIAELNTLQSQVGTLQTTADDQQGTIDGLQSTISDQQDTIDAQQTTIVGLQSDLTAVQSNTVLALDGMLGLGTDSNGYDTARFTAVNVQIVNGTGGTFNTNGLGNLTIGYNESITASQEPFCSSGIFDNENDCEAGGETWAIDQRSGSHNLVLGYGNAYSQYGGVLAGRYNIINGPVASISGGRENIASGVGASVSGGRDNTASGDYSSVSGGAGNTASGERASVVSGRDNIASGFGASVSGGRINTASGDYSSVSGGADNTADGAASAVTGGGLNTASALRASVSGGFNHSAADTYDWAAGSLFQDN